MILVSVFFIQMDKFVINLSFIFDKFLINDRSCLVYCQDLQIRTAEP